MESTISPLPRTGPRDVFLHLLVIIFLYICVISFGALLFQYITIAFPDPLYGDYGRYARASLRWPLATLTIIFPLFVALNSVLQGEIVREPLKRELKTRKWLIGFTLFLAAIVIAGDLVTLIYYFLSGELTVRFLLKVLAVLMIASAVFLYEGWNFRKDIVPSAHPQMKLFVRTVIGCAAIAIVAGFFVVGSPFAERKMQFDDRRIADLSSIQWGLINYWQAKEALPDSLEELRDPISGFVPPLDPETGMSYEYRKVGDFSFELCAVFNLPSEDQQTRMKSVPAYPYGEMQENWAHGAGRTCFERTIDPELYPPLMRKIPM